MRKPASLRPQSSPPAPENRETALTLPRVLRHKTIQFQKPRYADNAMDPFQRAKNVVQKVVARGGWNLASELLQSLLETEELRRFRRSPSPFVPLEEVFDDVAKVTVFAASLHPPVPSAEILTDDVSFYDIAEALMAAYAFGEFDVRYMPIARQRGKKISLRRVKRLLEEVGVFRDGILTGLGQMVAKSLLYYVARRGLYVESIYLSALVAHTLRAEMRNFSGSVKTVLMEVAARHKTLTDTIKEWLKTSPKLYHKELPLFYEWEDVIKDFSILHVKKEENFRFSI
jgi:hypothetical protein